MGDKRDVVSVDRLKPAFSDVPISSVLLPLPGRPALKPLPDAVLVVCPPQPPPPAVVFAPARWKTVSFHLPPEVPTCQNPHRAARGRRICSAISLLFLLGGVLWGIQDDSLLCPWARSVIMITLQPYCRFALCVYLHSCSYKYWID